MYAPIRHLFFDLDRTLWDFDKKSLQSLTIIYQGIHQRFNFLPSFEEFHKKYLTHNFRLWELYRQNEISKEDLNLSRFLLPMKECGLDDTAVATAMAAQYVELLSGEQELFPGAYSVIETLSENYLLHVITNGFEEIQHRKLNSSGLKKFFTSITTSEEAGYKKPDERIFKYALDKASALAEESVMIGDDPETDVAGAANMGMKQIYFEPEGNFSDIESTWKVNRLEEIPDLLRKYGNGSDAATDFIAGRHQNG